MNNNWVRKDFSEGSPIREPLLQKLLQRSSAVREIPEEYEDWIAAAGISDEERSAIDRSLQKKKE
ncbi:hypothetical protein NXH76_28360 [Blautia schinkii]|nr:hypothetical protein [Blautia schinkii]